MSEAQTLKNSNEELDQTLKQKVADSLKRIAERMDTANSKMIPGAALSPTSEANGDAGLGLSHVVLTYAKITKAEVEKTTNEKVTELARSAGSINPNDMSSALKKIRESDEAGKARIKEIALLALDGRGLNPEASDSKPSPNGKFNTIIETTIKAEADQGIRMVNSWDKGNTKLLDILKESKLATDGQFQKNSDAYISLMTKIGGKIGGLASDVVSSEPVRAASEVIKYVAGDIKMNPQFVKNVIDPLNTKLQAGVDTLKEEVSGLANVVIGSKPVQGYVGALKVSGEKLSNDTKGLREDITGSDFFKGMKLQADGVGAAITAMRDKFSNPESSTNNKPKM